MLLTGIRPCTDGPPFLTTLGFLVNPPGGKSGWASDSMELGWGRRYPANSVEEFTCNSAGKTARPTTKSSNNPRSDANDQTTVAMALADETAGDRGGGAQTFLSSMLFIAMLGSAKELCSENGLTMFGSGAVGPPSVNTYGEEEEKTGQSSESMNDAGGFATSAGRK